MKFKAKRTTVGLSLAETRARKVRRVFCPGRTLPPVEYPAGSVLRRVAAQGEVRWRNAKVLVGAGLVGEWVRLEEADDAVTVWYGPNRLRQIPRTLFPGTTHL